MKRVLFCIRYATTVPVRLWHSTSKWRQPRCRFEPGCSEYGIEAVMQLGIIRGWYLTLRRVARCHPWGGYGYDPVPAANSASRAKGRIV